MHVELSPEILAKIQPYITSGAYVTVEEVITAAGYFYEWQQEDKQKLSLGE